MRKIILFISSLGSGGAERQIVNLAIALKRKGFSVEILIYSNSSFYKPLLDKHDIRCTLLTSSNYFSRIYKIRKYLRNNDIGSVISFLEVPNFIACLSKIGGVSWKLITTERSSKLSTFTTLRSKLFLWFQRYSDYIVCNSYRAKKNWEKNAPVYSNKLSVIYNLIDNPQVNSQYTPIKNGRIHLVVAASYQYLKNPINVIKALSLLSDNDKKRILVNWYGRIEVSKNDTMAYDEAIRLIRINGLQNVIILNKESKSISNIMNEADIVGLFSKLEGLPNSICEALIIGKPIIMTRVSDYSNLVDSSNGFLCDWDSPESIKKALIQVVNLSSEQLIEMGNSSRHKAQKIFNNEKNITKWIKIIEK